MYDVELTNEHQRWRAREVTFYRGAWTKLRAMIPEFELAPFRSAPGCPENPFLRSVVRKPVTSTENPIPIATVSPAYTLAPHRRVADLCIEGLQCCGIALESMTVELGLSTLSEWMNLRIQLPDEFAVVDRLGAKTALRLECLNSVDGSSRLCIFFGWIRFVCSNGLIIGDTMIEIRERHDGRLDLDKVPGRIAEVFDRAEADRKRRLKMDLQKVNFEVLKRWSNSGLTDAWGKKAAARVFHISESGRDVEFTSPFAKGLASEKPTVLGKPVPGSPERAETLHDVMQAMSFVASSRVNAITQQGMKLSIDTLLSSLSQATMHD
jgi:hypothetical protein